MTLIKSISGIRGIIGGKPGEGLSPVDIIKFTAAYSEWILRSKTDKRCRLVLGRDARPTGEIISRLVSGTIASMGIDVVDLGLATTPTVEIAVSGEKADGGIIITASHNPVQWNALKLLNVKGEFISAADGEQIPESGEKDNRGAGRQVVMIGNGKAAGSE
jgi:phosphomannomutase